MKTAEEKFNIILDYLQSGMSINKICQKYGISHSQFKRWQAIVTEASIKALSINKHSVKSAFNARCNKIQDNLKDIVSMFDDLNA